MKQAKTFAVGLFLILFISFLVLAYSTTYPAHVRTVVGEGFAVNPTRASDCQCLSGYVPSNQNDSKYGGKFIRNGGLIAFQPDGGNTKHLVSNCLRCDGINPCTEAKDVSKTTWESLSWGEQYRCSLFTQAKANAKKITNTFFCQSLSDPQGKRSCY